MNKKNINNILLATLVTCITTPSILEIISSCHAKSYPSWVDSEVAEHDPNAWQHAIQYIASCKHPTIYMCVPASMQIQQVVNMYLSSSILAQELNHTYMNQEYIHNDNILLVPFSRAYQLKTDTSIGNFNYKYSTLINDNYGLKNIIKYGVSNANNMVITNLQDFNVSLSEYDKTASDYAEFNSFGYALVDNPEVGLTWIEKILNKIFSLYPNGTKFNIVWSDIDFWNASNLVMSPTSYTSPMQDIIVKLFQKIDKVFTVSEGWNTFYKHDLYKKWYLSHGYITYAQKKDLWDYIKIAPYEKAKQLISTTHLWYTLANCEKFVTSFSTGNEALLSSKFLDKESNLIKETAIKPAYPWFSIYSYKKLFINQADSPFFTKFVESFLNFYLFNDGKSKSFSDYIIDTSEIPNNFDQNKKNLIFLLPSYMARETTAESEAVLKEFKKTIDKIIINYPINNWNYIYKFHPRADDTKVVDCLKTIFDGAIPKNAVVLKHTIPSEYLFTLDDYLVKSGKEKFYHLIDPNTLNQDKPNGIITGDDLVSTSVYTAMEILANELNQKWDNVKKVIQTDAYFIPSTYKFESTNIGDYAEYNQKWINDFYQPFYEIGQFINPNDFELIK